MTHCTGCLNSNIVTNYQNQQRIWNSVRIDSSQYTMNKLLPPNPVWNQQSDRQYPHVQIAIPSHGNSTKRTLTRARPGAGAPGGVGCDIKFNSYVRYLNRLKGKALQPGVPDIAPMYGGKYFKTTSYSLSRFSLNSLHSICFP